MLDLLRELIFGLLIFIVRGILYDAAYDIRAWLYGIVKIRFKHILSHLIK